MTTDNSDIRAMHESADDIKITVTGAPVDAPPLIASEPPSPLNRLSEEVKVQDDQELSRELEFLGALQASNSRTASFASAAISGRRKSTSGTLSPLNSMASAPRRSSFDVRRPSRFSSTVTANSGGRRSSILPSDLTDIQTATPEVSQSKFNAMSAGIYQRWNKYKSAHFDDGDDFRHHPQRVRRRRTRIATCVIGSLIAIIVLIVTLFFCLGCSPLGCKVGSVNESLDSHILHGSKTEASFSPQELQEYPRLQQMTQYLLSTIPATVNGTGSVSFVNVTTHKSESIPILPFQYSLAPEMKDEHRPDGYVSVGTPFCGRLVSSSPIFGMYPSNTLPTSIQVVNSSLTNDIQISNYSDTSAHGPIHTGSFVPGDLGPATALDMPYCCVDFFSIGYNRYHRLMKKDVNARLYCKTGPAGGIWSGWNELLHWNEGAEDTWVSKIQTGLSLGQRYKAQPDAYETYAAFFTTQLGSITAGVSLRTKALVPMNLFPFHQTVLQNQDAVGIRLDMNAHIPASSQALDKLSKLDSRFVLDYAAALVDTSRLLPSPWQVTPYVGMDNGLQITLYGPLPQTQYYINQNSASVTFQQSGCPAAYDNKSDFCIAATLKDADVTLEVSKTRSSVSLETDDDFRDMVITRIRAMYNGVPITWSNKIESNPFAIPDLSLYLKFMSPDHMHTSNFQRWFQRGDYGKVFVMLDGASPRIPISSGKSTPAALGGNWWELEMGMTAQVWSSSRSGELVIGYIPPRENPECILIEVGVPVSDARLPSKKMCIGFNDLANVDTVGENLNINVTHRNDLPMMAKENNPANLLSVSWQDVRKYHIAIKSALLQSVSMIIDTFNSSSVFSNNHSGPSTFEDQISFGPVDVYTESLLLSGNSQNLLIDGQARSLSLFNLPMGLSEKFQSLQQSSQQLSTQVVVDDHLVLQLRVQIDPITKEISEFFNNTISEVDQSPEQFLLEKSGEIFADQNNGASIDDVSSKASTLLQNIRDSNFLKTFTNLTQQLGPYTPLFMNIVKDWQSSTQSVNSDILPRDWVVMHSLLSGEDSGNLMSLNKTQTPLDMMATAMALNAAQNMLTVSVNNDTSIVRQASLFLDDQYLNSMVLNSRMAFNASEPARESVVASSGQTVCKLGVCRPESSMMPAFITELQARNKEYLKDVIQENVALRKLPSEIDVLVDVSVTSGSIQSLIDTLIVQKLTVRAAWMTTLYLHLLQELNEIVDRNELYKVVNVDVKSPVVSVSAKMTRLVMTLSQLTLFKDSSPVPAQLTLLNARHISMWQVLECAINHCPVNSFLQTLFDLHVYHGESFQPQN